MLPTELYLKSLCLVDEAGFVLFWFFPHLLAHKFLDNSTVSTLNLPLRVPRLQIHDCLVHVCWGLTNFEAFILRAISPTFRCFNEFVHMKKWPKNKKLNKTRAFWFWFQVENTRLLFFMLNIMKSTEFYISSADKKDADRWGQPTKNSGNMRNGIEMRPLGFLYASVTQSGCWRSWQSGRMMEPPLKNELQPKIFLLGKSSRKRKACLYRAC